MLIGSFDIGKKNFAFYVEEFDEKKLELIENIDKNSRYNEDGTPTSKFENILKEVYLNGNVILFKNVDLTVNCKKTKYLDPNIFHNLTYILDEYKKIWNVCEYIIIEQQMSFGKKINTMALKIGQHCYSYFLFNYGKFKTVIEFPAYFKTQTLGACKILKVQKNGKKTYKAIDKPARKKWSIDKALNIISDRNDVETLSLLTSKKKKDDLADVLCQCQSFKYLYFVEKMEF
jgi:hypothetical protein